MIKINDSVWHPCSLDIIEHKIVSIRQYENFTHYTTKAVHDVGACGRVSVLLDEHNNKLRFVSLVEVGGRIETANGLGDFIEGNYYIDKRLAELEYYEQQEVLSWSNMEQKRTLYEEAKNRHDKLSSILKRVKDSLKEIKNK